jgi:hypothetical protein
MMNSEEISDANMRGMVNTRDADDELPDRMIIEIMNYTMKTVNTVYLAISGPCLLTNFYISINY